MVLLAGGMALAWPFVIQHVAAAPITAVAAAGQTTAAAAGSSSIAVAGTVGPSTVAVGYQAGFQVAAAGPVVVPLAWGALVIVGHSRVGPSNFDCWKPILHDSSADVSQGKTLSDLMQDDRIKDVRFEKADNPGEMFIYVQNIWNQTFVLEFQGELEDGRLAAHAVLLE